MVILVVMVQMMMQRRWSICVGSNNFDTSVMMMSMRYVVDMLYEVLVIVMLCAMGYIRTQFEYVMQERKHEEHHLQK